MIPHLGIQNDEVLFGAGIYEPFSVTYFLTFLGRRVPLMLMSYIGGLKGWLYAAVFEFWKPGAASIRVPMLLAGVASIWLFFVLLRRISGTRAAVIGAVLLATDTSYLLTVCFDWGPVALQHLLLIGGVLLLVRFCRQPGRWTLAGGCFLLGLGLWDKALFSWMLGGLAVAAAVVYPRELLQRLSLSRAGVAVAAFALGSFPLLWYNVNHGFDTFRSNAAWSADDLPGRARCLRSSLDGSVLFGWLVAEDAATPTPRQPQTLLSKCSAALSAATGKPRRNLEVYAFFLALFLFVLLIFSEGWKGPVRVLAFTLVFGTVGWLQMALTRGAGGSVHHTVLLWPAPQAFTAVAFAAASRHLRGFGCAFAVALVTLVAFSGLLVTNEYYTLMMRNGGALNWTDAMYPLAAYMEKLPSRLVFITDWGILDTLRVLDRGKLNLRVGSDPALETMRTWVAESDNVFVGHTEGNEFFPENSRKLQQLAAQMGFRRELLQVVADRNHRPIFEVFRFVPDRP